MLKFCTGVPWQNTTTPNFQISRFPSRKKSTDILRLFHWKNHKKSTEPNFRAFSPPFDCDFSNKQLLCLFFFRNNSQLKSYGPAKLKKLKNRKLWLFEFQKFVKNRKNQNFSSLTQNSVPTFLWSKRKHSWLFFEIGIENTFLGGKNRKSRKKPEKRPFFCTKLFFSRKPIVTSFQKSYILFL